ncbi:hypothetical protein [Chitinophaga sp. CF418]|uniref:hypothetical protein n=1 Tax=Chitinophaga sp. CF418 TaxID=1855287 RepID=UPI000916AA23|nr:hypothetical protein [Chitinophaga sp. CF418]SHN28481.1 hypothetical protein SAMN05216311_108100 [Chitinophaga sp. CF418]
MYTQLTPLPVKGIIHGQWHAQIEKIFAWLTALLLAGMTFPLWKSIVIVVFEKLYEVLIMQHY